MKNEPVEFLPVKPFWTDAPSRHCSASDLVLRGFILGCAFCGLVFGVCAWLSK